MAPGLGILFAAAVILIWAVFCTGCLAVLLWGLHRKSRPLTMRAGFLLSLGLLLGFFTAFGNEVLPPGYQARQLMNLPAEAKVIRVEYGEWSGDGTVHFRLPPSRSPEAWIEKVWTMNPVESEAQAQGLWISKEAYGRLATYGGNSRRELRYDPRTQVYTYSVQLES